VENTASILILISGIAHAVVNAILKAGNDKMSRRALIDGFSALILAPAAFLVPLPANAWHWLIASALVHGVDCARARSDARGRRCRGYFP
jgi:predicted MFS family arabinose efflux permease